jgi:SAM-dependent methyltransferase
MNEVSVEGAKATAAAARERNEATNAVDAATARRWDSEASFFDRLGQRLEADLKPFTPWQLGRYLAHPRRIYDKEFRFRLLGDLGGQRVLDLGCGEGSNSVLLARAGATVVGVDLSPKLVELAHRRAALNNVADRVRFHCSPIERVELEPRSFDLIWGDGVLHHLLDVLEPTLQRLLTWARPGARFLFSEPVNLNPLLRRLRLKVPIHTDATPDERPLEARELALLRRYLPGLKLRHFHALSRFTRFVVPLSDYEGAPLWRRAGADLLHAVDYAALGLGPLRTLGGMAVLSGHAPS